MRKFNLSISSFPRASIIEGGNSLSRKELATEIAMKLFCITGVACGTCNQCVKIKAGSHPDFFYFNEDSLKVDTAREIVKAAYTKPSEAENKIFILDNGDNIRIEAQNALLKVIEEPQNGYFIFLCQNSRSLLSTILSRCQIFPLPPSENHEEKKELLELAQCFKASLNSELELCDFFTKVSAFNRLDFKDFLILLKKETHTMLLKNNFLNSTILLKIYDYLDSLTDTLPYNPNISALCLSSCVKIWEIIENYR